MHPWQLLQYAHKLQQGTVIAYPTETIWGFGCIPQDEHALIHLAQIKQRSLKKGFILLSPNIELCLPFIRSKFHNTAINNIKLNKHSPTTWLAPKSTLVPNNLSGDSNKIAIRISPHPFIKDICHLINSPLVSTSANTSHRPNLDSALLIRRHFKQHIKHIIHGYENGSGRASHIIDLQSKQLLR